MPWGKEYIDFSFAGKHISDFGLVAVTDSNRYRFASAPEFEDETSTVKGVWGQYYWGTSYKTNTYNFSLATDGMTERQFEEFKRHFRPGHYGQFYEDAWFDKYCYVRVKSIVEFNFVPFQQEVEMAGAKFMSRVYKGECKISFVQDKPFKYAFQQVLDSKIADLARGGDNVEAALRMMYHSNIPARDSWIKTQKCATGSWFSLPAKNSTDTTNVFARADSIPFYNPSTVDSETKIEFTLDRSITPINTIEWEPVYFNEIYDDYTNDYAPYNTISVSDNISASATSLADTKRYIKTFKYGMPEVSSEINKAIDVAWRFYQENPRGALVELQEDLQEELINTRVLLWAIKILQKIQINPTLYKADENELEISPLVEEEDTPGCLRTEKITVYLEFLKVNELQVDWFGYFNLMMLMMFAECAPYEQNDITTPNVFSSFYPYTLYFDGEQAQTYVTYICNYLGGDGSMSHEQIIGENCSNIMASEYLSVDGGDTLDVSTGRVASYHMLRFNHGTNEAITVRDIKLEYKYTYA